jgi:phosphoribosylformylglycinamidine synthase
VVGLLDPWERHAVAHFREGGEAVVLLGETREEFGGSEWLAVRRGLEAGAPPAVDLEAETRLHALLARGAREGWLLTAHDVSDGGLAVALAECTFSAGVGARVELGDSIRPDALLFGESTGRVVAATRDPEALLAAAREEGLPARRVGETGGERLVVGPPGGEPWIDCAVARLREIWARALPRRLEVA